MTNARPLFRLTTAPTGYNTSPGDVVVSCNGVSGPRIVPYSDGPRFYMGGKFRRARTVRGALCAVAMAICDGRR